MERKAPLIFIVLFLSFLLAGCCHPPIREISLTRARLERAQKTGATAYAPKEYQEAQELLKKAQTLASRKCGEAWKTLKLAQMKIQEAQTSAQKARLQARQKAQEAIKEAQKTLEEARQVQAPRYAPDLYLVAEELLKKARKTFQKGDYIQSQKEAQKAAQLALKAKDAAIKVQKALAGTLNP